MQRNLRIAFVLFWVSLFLANRGAELAMAETDDQGVSQPADSYRVAEPVHEKIAVPHDTGGSEDEHSVGHKVLFYIPNRILDFFDIFRFRVRVGPGFALGARATSVAQVYAGTYTSIWAGLPGPRLSSSIPIPLGIESNNGATVSVVDATADGGVGPGYSSSEVGVGLQLAIVGVDLGFDPVEIADFVTGFVTVDLRGDDL